MYADRIAIRLATPLPAGIWPIIDPAWLLDGGRLSVDGTTSVAGRTGLRITVDGRKRSVQGPLSGRTIAADTIDMVIDTELGIALRQVCYTGGQPILRVELSNVTPGADPAVFRVEPPPGMPVITSGLLAESGLSAVQLAWSVGKSTAGLAAEAGRRWLKRPRP